MSDTVPQASAFEKLISALERELPMIGDSENVWCMVRGYDLRAAVAHLIASQAPAAIGEPADALGYATRLAVAIHAKHFAHVSQWPPLPDLLGVLTQIDNMTSGLAPVARQASPAVSGAAQALFDNRLGWSECRPPYAPRELWADLGAALYGERDARVQELRAASPAVSGAETKLPGFDQDAWEKGYLDGIASVAAEPPSTQSEPYLSPDAGFPFPVPRRAETDLEAIGREYSVDLTGQPEDGILFVDGGTKRNE